MLGSEQPEQGPLDRVLRAQTVPDHALQLARWRSRSGERAQASALPWISRSAELIEPMLLNTLRLSM
jgi:hypothetical protein